MKTIIIALILAAFLFIGNNISKSENISGNKTVIIDLTGNMICSTSINIIKKALKKVKGVENIEFDSENKKVTVSYNDSLTDLNSLETAISNSGFKANDKEADMMAFDSLPGCCKTK